MKKSIMLLALLSAASLSNAQQYKVITTIESIVPGGLGRSRMVEESQEIDYKTATTSREGKGDADKQKDVDRSDLKTPKGLVEAIGAGGLSGAPVRGRSTEVIRYITQKSGGKIPIIAVGGIFTAADAKEKVRPPLPHTRVAVA